MLSTYRDEKVSLAAWDSRCPAVAARLVRHVKAHLPELELEHVGSSSVPGLAGKNVVDLAAQVPPARMREVADVLVHSGWQRQTGPRAHPDTRPMLRAAIEHEGDLFRAHLHLLPVGGAEWPIMIGFRDRLRADPALRERYVARKRAVLAEGIDHGPDYAEAKSDVVVEALRELGLLPG